jgi:gas vesicle protein
MTLEAKPLKHLLVGLLIGGSLGALAGILLAPKSGRELRSEIKKKGRDVLDEAKDFYDDAGAKVTHVVEEARQQAKDLKKDAERHILEASLKAKEILTIAK